MREGGREGEEELMMEGKGEKGEEERDELRGGKS